MEKSLSLVACALLLLISLMILGPGAQGLAIQQQASDAATSSPSTTSSPVSSSPSSSAASSTTQQPSQHNNKPLASSSSRHHNHHQTSSSAAAAAASRQSPASFATSLISALGSMVPGLITNVAPLVLLFGIGALLMPALGLNAATTLSRESRPSLPEQLVPAQSSSWPALYYPNALQQTLFAAAQQQHQQQQRARPGLGQDYYYLSKRSLDSPASSAGASSGDSQFNWPSSGQIAYGLKNLLEQVARAIDNAELQYGSSANTNVKSPTNNDNNKQN